MQNEESFGIIPLSCEQGIWKVFLIQHKKARYWGFPKGHAEKGETPQTTALRELKEETNLDFVSYVLQDPFIEHYQFTVRGKKVSKKVAYFAALVSGKVKLQSQEVENGLWMTLPEALEKLTYAEGKSLLTQLAKNLSSR